MQILYLVLILSIPLVLCVENSVVRMVMSFVTHDEKPTTLLTPHLCWKSYRFLDLARVSSKHGISITSSLQPNRNENFLQHIIIIADLSCGGTEDFLRNANAAGYMKSPYRWLILNLNNEPEHILEDIATLVDSDVVIARRNIDGDVAFVEVYKIYKGTEIIRTLRMIWHAPEDMKYQNSSEPCNETETTIVLRNTVELVENKYGMIEDYRKTKVLSRRRQDLKKQPLTMVLVITDTNETRHHLNDRLQLQHDSITKMTYMAVHICFEILNATEVVKFTNTWGYKDKDGNWQGIIDHLLKDQADLGTLTIFTKERMQVIDYIAMIGSTSVRFVFREPPLAYVSNIFTLPFSAAVWVAIAICVLSCAVFIYFASKWEATVDMHPLQLDGSWADVLILIIGAVLQQGCTLEPRYAAGRIITLLLFLALTILYAAYSANIVVLLRAPSSSVRSLQDLLDSPLKAGASDFEYNRYFFKKLNEPIRKAIYDKKIAPKGRKPNFFSMEEGVEKIREGLFAFHMELNPGYRLIQQTYQEHEKCDLVEIDYINEIDPWVPSQKRSPFKDLFKITFIKIRESGIQSCIHRRLHVPRPRCLGTVSTFSSVGITDMYPALLATLYGMMMAIPVLLLEILYKRLMLKRGERKIKSHRNNEHFHFIH